MPLPPHFLANFRLVTTFFLISSCRVEARLRQPETKIQRPMGYRDLHQAMERGAFRHDLYYRLQVFTIQLPPLRERQADILPLAEAFLRDSVSTPLRE